MQEAELMRSSPQIVGSLLLIAALHCIFLQDDMDT